MIHRPKPERFRLRRTMMFMSAQKPGLIKDAYIYSCESNKLDLEDVLERSTRVDEGVLASAGGMSVGDIQSDAVQALVALGYGSTESMKAVKKAGDAYTTVEELLKAALKMMF